MPLTGILDLTSRERTSFERLARAIRMALDLCTIWSVRPQDWMLDDLWDAHIGCANCLAAGPGAACWGRVGCHGFHNGCGCRPCSARARYGTAAGGDRHG